MTRSKQLLGAVSSLALVALSVSPAMAADLGTNAGVDITNTVTVNFKVNDVSQTAVQDTDTLTVDRKVNLTVADVNGTTTVVSGETGAAVAFQVSNLTNDTVDLVLSLDQSTTDSGDLSNVQFYVEDGTTAGFQAGEDILVTYLEDMAEDETRTVYVVGDLPGALTAGDQVDVNLVADAHATIAATGTGAGVKFANTAGGNTAGVDTVLADGAGTVDNANEGDHSDLNSFVVANAGVTVSKISRVISDPVNGTTDPKAVPGAVVEYCIAVINAGGFAATEIVVSDPLPTQVTFAPDQFGGTGDIVINGSLDGSGFCTGGTPTDKSYTVSTTTVSNPLADVAAGATSTLYFRVTID
uniref:DUF11 domain-containing protein n=1 Tax=Parerythrobacter lutipelagi TaxID=1964208 RepID=UPI0010F5FAF5|nr:DUF11 domain-containing protein [Parerythrobacter lutipelagi]